jgi:hypothetical protein
MKVKKNPLIYFLKKHFRKIGLQVLLNKQADGQHVRRRGVTSD